jgi:hypothetical protein
MSIISRISPPKMTSRIIREATAKSKDGRIDQSDFLNYSASSSRYSLFTPMEASIIFHFAGRGDASQRLALIDFAQLLDPRWRAPHDIEALVPKPESFVQTVLHATYNFVQGGEPSACSVCLSAYNQSPCQVSLVPLEPLLFILLTWVSGSTLF